jgi:hypothetical protein
MPKTKTERKFRTGDRVRFRYGIRWIRGTVTEDRGPIGVGGRRLYGVEFRFGGGPEPRYSEFPAEDLRPVPARAAAR